MKTALHSISYAGTWGQANLSLEDFIRKAAKLGFDGVMIAAKRPHASVLDMTPGKLADLKKVMDDSGVSLAAIAGYTDFTVGLKRPDTPVIEMQIDHVRKLSEMAAALGGNIVRVFTGYTQPEIPFNTQWNICVQALKEAARAAAEFKVTLAVQNHHDIAVHCESQVDLINEIDEPNCRAGFDAWSVVLGGEDIVKAVSLVSPVTCQTIVADYVRRPRFSYQPELVNYTRDPDMIRAVPMGEGFIDYAKFLTTLGECGFREYVTYEMCSPLKGGGSEDNLDSCAREFLKFMKKLGGKV